MSASRTAQLDALPQVRLYRVLPSRPEDHPALAGGAADHRQLITIHRIDGAKMILSDCDPWRDTDAWAGWRWRKADQDRRLNKWGGR